MFTRRTLTQLMAALSLAPAAAVAQVAQEQIILLQTETVKTEVQVQLHLIQDHQ